MSDKIHYGKLISKKSLYFMEKTDTTSPAFAVRYGVGSLCEPQEDLLSYAFNMFN